MLTEICRIHCFGFCLRHKSLNTKKLCFSFRKHFFLFYIISSTIQTDLNAGIWQPCKLDYSKKMYIKKCLNIFQALSVDYLSHYHHLGQGFKTQISWWAEIFFDIFKGQSRYVSTHSKCALIKERSKI
jgi:hypothetical protein